MSVEVKIIPELMIDFLKEMPIGQIVEFSGEWAISDEGGGGTERFAVVLSTYPLVIVTINSGKRLPVYPSDSRVYVESLGPLITLAPDVVEHLIATSGVDVPRSTYEPELVKMLPQHIARHEITKRVTAPMHRRRGTVPEWAKTVEYFPCILKDCMLGEVSIGNANHHYLYTPWSKWGQYIPVGYFKELLKKD